MLTSISRRLSSIAKMIKQNFDDAKFTGVRLPTNVVPKHYQLTLKPDLVNFTFSGSVKIDFEAHDANRIILNCNGVQITEGYVEANEYRQLIEEVTYSKATETAIFDFSQSIPAKGSLFLNFNGCLNDMMKGFYRSAFMVDGKQVYAATTQFESTDARRCFPCWDEPAVKATFGVNLVVDPKLVALSNCEEVSRVPEGDLVNVGFATTPIMSTYLLAFIVGPFEYIEAHDGKRPVRVYTTPGKIEHGRFALDVTVKSLAFYEKYFNIDYPLAKMDLIAIPDFTSGAMENWGLVTYRETSLLVDPQNTSTIYKQWVALTVAHEIAHQWFGNLVTMEWWTHLWLNEGFASFMEFLCADSFLPEYELWTQFISSELESSMNLDALNNSHPIEVPVNHPSEVEEIFDAISYQKGASIIRMLYHYIGDSSFREGMKDYLTKFSYKNTVTEDLWDCLARASKKPVAEMMSGWTAKKGFPWISVKAVEDVDNIKLTLSQSKFNCDGKICGDEADYKWSVPISYSTGDDPTRVIDLGLLEEKEKVFTIPKTDSWIKLNPGSTSFCRVAYPQEWAERLIPAISNKVLSPVDRIGLQSDSFALCKAGKISAVEYLKLLDAYQKETDLTVWQIIDGSMSELNILLSNSDYKDKLHSFGRKLYSQIYKRLTWDKISGETHGDSLARPMIINRLITFGDSEVVEEALKRFTAQVEKSIMVPADLRRAVYKAVAIYGSDSQFDTLVDLHKSADSSEERNNVERTLGFSKDSKRCQRACDFIMSDQVRNQDKVHSLLSVCASSPDVAWQLFKDKKDFFKEKYGTGHLAASAVKFTTEYFTTEEKAQEIDEFFKNNPFPGTERSVQQSIEKIRLRVAWLRRDEESLRAFLCAQ